MERISEAALLNVDGGGSANKTQTGYIGEATRRQISLTVHLTTVLNISHVQLTSLKY